MSRSPLLVCLLLLGLSRSDVHGQVVPQGPQFQINSYTTYDQRSAGVAFDPTGGFVVAWGSPTDGSGYLGSDIAATRFAQDGTPREPEFIVNSETSAFQGYPRVAVAPNGDFVVVWMGPSAQDPTLEIVGRRFDSSGAPRGTDFAVNSFTSAFQYWPDVAAAPDGSFLVVWESQLSPGNDTSDSSILGRLFDANANPVTPDFQVNSFTLSPQKGPRVATAPNGGFLVVWSSYFSLTDGFYSIQAQRFDGSGNPVGTQFEVNSYTTGEQYRPDLAVDGSGRFIVSWQSTGSGGSDVDNRSIQARRFAADGSPLGDDFQVNSETADDQYWPSVAVDATGNFVVAWETEDSLNPNAPDLFGRAFSSAGQPLGADFGINSYSTSWQLRSQVAMSPAGDVLVAWTSQGSNGSDIEGNSIQGQRYRLLVIFLDDFESGDTARWSSTLP